MPAAAPARRGLMHISRQIPALCPFFSPIQPLDRCQQAGSLMSTFPKTSSRRSFSASPAQVSADKSPSIVWTTHKLSPEQVLKVDKIFHKILWLDIFESSMLTELVNEKLGLVMTKKQRRQLEARMVALEKGEAGGGGGAAQKQEEEEAKPALVDVKLIAFDAKQKIKVIKEVRGALELGLKEAKALVEGAPVPLQKGMQPEAAAELKSKLEGAGATIELVDA